MLAAHDDTKRLWGGHCGGCLELVWPLLEGARADAERELVDVRGWELFAGDQIRVVLARRPLPGPAVAGASSPRARAGQLDEDTGARGRADVPRSESVP